MVPRGPAIQHTPAAILAVPPRGTIARLLWGGGHVKSPPRVAVVPVVAQRRLGRLGVRAPLIAPTVPVAPPLLIRQSEIAPLPLPRLLQLAGEAGDLGGVQVHADVLDAGPVVVAVRQRPHITLAPQEIGRASCRESGGCRA